MTSSLARRGQSHPTKTSRKSVVVSEPAKPSDYSALPLFLWFPPDDQAFLAGVLRKTYKKHVNTAAGFIRSKLHPVKNPDADSQWLPTAERFESVLPPLASDGDRDIRSLAERFDSEVLPHKQSLLVYLTLRFPDDASLQRGWELGRAFALRNLALRRGLASVIVQHAPHRMGSSNPPHLHLMIFPRELTPLGFGSFDDAITTDAGLECLYEEWSIFVQRWPG